MATPLTERQSEALDFIRDYLRRHQKPPTLTELADGLGLRSTNAVSKILAALAAKGYIERERGTARGVRLVQAEADPFALTDAAPKLIVVSRTSSHEPDHLRRAPAAMVTVDPALFGGRVSPDTCLVVRAGDDGMDADGIRTGDFLIVEEMHYKRIPDETIVACLFDEKPLARRYTFANGHLYLRPSNRRYKPADFSQGDPHCFVIGRVVGVMRRL